MGSPRASVAVMFLAVVLLTLAAAAIGSSADLEMDANPSYQQALELTRLAQGDQEAKPSPQDLAAGWAAQWPAKFTISFTTNDGAVRGVLAYDWYKQRQITTHGPNGVFCGQFPQAKDGAACSFYMDVNSTYLYVPSTGECCKVFSTVQILPPNWTNRYEKYTGLEWVSGVGWCNGFYFGDATKHSWYQTAIGGFPCMFSFPTPAHGNMVFDLITYRVGLADDKYFNLPLDTCYKNSCVVGDSESQAENPEIKMIVQ